MLASSGFHLQNTAQKSVITELPGAGRIPAYNGFFSPVGELPDAAFDTE